MQNHNHQRFIHLARIVIALAFVCVGLGTTASAADEAAAVRAVIAQYAKGLETGDMAALEKIWAQDDATSVAEAGSFNHGWADFRDHHLRPEIEGMKNVKFLTEDLRVHVNGKLAWVTFNYKMSGESKGRAFDNTGAATMVLEKRGKAWLIVHQHTSAKRRPATPAPPAK
jgi:uncharacterized protein (TIGR02246 family)